LIVGLLLTATLVLAGCGGSSTKAPEAPAVREQGPFGVEAERFWLYLPAKGSPKAIVVFLHGLGKESLKPDLYRPWLQHLAAKGNAVIYPVYELGPGSRGALRNLITAVRDAKLRLKSPFVPTVVVGYSRGGRLAVEYAAVAPGVEQTPSAVMSVFPGLLNPDAEEVVDFASIHPATRIWILVGDRDRSVGRQGGRELLARLQRGNFSPANIRVILVTSKGDFEASHGAPLGTSPDAQREFWDRADRLVDMVTRETG
jgi:poly(3-hydroxybutyrate) depolymerase